MSKPKYQIDESFISSHKGNVVIIGSYFDERENDYIYAVEYTDYDGFLYGCHSEREISIFLGEQND